MFQARPEIEVYARLCLKHDSFGRKKRIINANNAAIEFASYANRWENNDFFSKVFSYGKKIAIKTSLYSRHGQKTVLLFYILHF